MAKLDVRRGAFRLWLVDSVVWILVIWVLTQSVVQAGFKERADYDAMAKSPRHHAVVKVPTYVELVPHLCGDARGRLHSDFDRIVPNGADAPVGPPNPFDNCWYAMADYRRLYPDQAAISDFELLQRTYKDAGEQPPTPTPTATQTPATGPRPDPWPALWQALLFGFALPVVIFIAGAALLWALAGFKTRPDDARNEGSR